MPVHRFAAIDIGTNSIKCVLMSPEAPAAWRVLDDRVVITRLGRNLKTTGRLDPEGIERSIQAVAELLDWAERAGAEAVVASGTMALRSAENASEFTGRVETGFGLSVRVIAGEEEARLSFLAAVAGGLVPPGEHLVMDIGGGSTELIRGDRDRIRCRTSLEMGALHLTEQFLGSDPPTAAQIANARAHVAHNLAAVPLDGFAGRLIGIGGTATALASVSLGLREYDRDRIHGLGLTDRQIFDQLDRLGAMTVEARKQVPGLPAGRADIILGGLLILAGVMRQLHESGIIICGWGLRHGLLIDTFGSSRLRP